MEQKLVDAMFQMVITAAQNEWFRDKDSQQVAEWVRKQLALMGVDVIVVGSSYGILVKKDV